MEIALIEAAKREAERLGLHPAALLAVIEIESAGRTFAIVNGKPEPLIRFEGHWFDRRLEGSSKARARLQGLASATAGVVKNPASQTGRWALLDKAMKIDRQAALESTSWGIGQVMGGHWKWLGYETVDALFDDARSGAPGQLRLMLRFIEKSGLNSALAFEDWKRFSLAYNGRNAIRRGYDQKLAQAFARWQHQKFNEPDSVASSPASSSSAIASEMDTRTTIRRGSIGEDVTDLQAMLTARGFPAGASGVFDQQAEKALRAFQKHAQLAVDGIAGPKTRMALSGSVAPRSAWQILKSWLSRLRSYVVKSI